MADELLWKKPLREGNLSADALKHPHVFDIHGGGIDLQFPHHENEVAQSCCANHTEVMANVWMHNGFLQVEGEKMAKSLGNFFTVKDLLDDGVPGEVMRFVLLSTHYRQPLDWTKDRLDAAYNKLRRWSDLTAGITPTEAIKFPVPLDGGILAALADDLNTPLALGKIDHIYDPTSSNRGGGPKSLAKALVFMGFSSIVGGWNSTSDEIATLVAQLISVRVEARNTRDFKKADTVRDGLAEAGVLVSDSRDGTSWQISRDVIDASSFFHAYRRAASVGDEAAIKTEKENAKRAGIHFTDQDPATAVAWRTVPTEAYTIGKLRQLLELEALK